MRGSVKNRNYVFTIFAGEHMLDGPLPLDPDDFPPWISFLVYQVELCPDTQRVHFQGYLECVGQQRWMRIKNEVPGFEAAHLEVRHGTQQQAIAYATKEDTRLYEGLTFGTPKEQGLYLSFALAIHQAFFFQVNVPILMR